MTKEGKSHEAATQSNATKVTKLLATRALLYLGTEDDYIRKLVISTAEKRDEGMDAAEPTRESLTSSTQEIDRLYCKSMMLCHPKLSGSDTFWCFTSFDREHSATTRQPCDTVSELCSSLRHLKMQVREESADSALAAYPVGRD